MVKVGIEQVRRTESGRPVRRASSIVGHPLQVCNKSSCRLGVIGRSGRSFEQPGKGMKAARRAVTYLIRLPIFRPARKRNHEFSEISAFPKYPSCESGKLGPPYAARCNTVCVSLHEPHGHGRSGLMGDSTHFPDMSPRSTKCQSNAAWDCCFPRFFWSF